jgi:acetoin utilization deacetylase AcuC-like enzyme
MILYDPKRTHGFEAYGIQIPIRDSRARRTFERLVRHPQLSRRIAEWHRRPGPETLTAQDLLRVHTGRYVDRLFSRALEDEIVRTYELMDADGRFFRYAPETAVRPLTDLFERILQTAAGTVQCCRLALANGFCFYFGGGMHHARSDSGSGFCLINDIVIGIRKLQAEHRIQRAWVIDVDAHKGDGTAELTAADDAIVTLSIHMARGWPLDGERYGPDGRRNPSFTPSTIDIPVDTQESGDYLPKLRWGLATLASYAAPDIAVVVCGADPFEDDQLPSTQALKLTLEQLKERDLTVYRFLDQRNIPGAFLMAGGYGDHAWRVYSQFLETILPERLDPRDVGVSGSPTCVNPG